MLTGVKNAASSCLITEFYFQFYIQLAPFFPPSPSLCTWGPSRWQNRRACFAVICLLIVDRVGRIPLPSVIPLWHRLSVALSCPLSPWVASTADGVSLSFRDSAHIRLADRTYTVVYWQHDGQLNQCKPKLAPGWKRTASIRTSLQESIQKFQEVSGGWEFPAEPGRGIVYPFSFLILIALWKW